MKITELVGIKNQLKKLPDPAKRKYGTTVNPPDEFTSIMTDNGFSVMGTGSEGTVWSHPNLSYVLKLFNATDRAYIDWVSVSMKHKNNPHMPKFISPRVIRITSDIVAIRMESLRPVKEYSELWRVYEYSDSIIASGLELDTLPSEVIEDDKRISKQPGFQQKHFDIFNKYCQSHPQWIEALDIVCNFFKTSNHFNDLHGGNLMIRDSDTLVITDPASTN